MKLRRLLGIVPMLLIAASGLAQLTSDQKTEVLDEMDHVMKTEAFVPGVDLTKWRSFLDARKDRLEAADSPRAFTTVVNSALKEFGLSHIMLMRDRARGEPDLAILSAQRRGGFQRRGPALSWIDDDSALVRIPDFESSYDAFGMAQIMTEAKDAKYLVLDLRGNPGGEVDRMRHFLGFLMPSDSTIGTFVSRKMAQDYESSGETGSDPIAIAKWARREVHPLRSTRESFKGKVAVLVDRGSASAAEIIANALRENNRSLVVGTPTAGAVLVSTFDRLPYGFKLQIPVGDYVSHGGVRLEGHPIVPDLNATGETAVESALAKLKGK